MNQVLQVNITVDELKEIIREVIKVEINNIPKPVPEDKYLRTDEVCEMLKVSQNTLGKYRKDGKLPYYRFGRRLYFKKSEVIKSFKKIDMSKYL